MSPSPSTSFQAAAAAAVMSSISYSNSDEPQWLIQIRQTLEEEHEDDENNTICISHVPNALMSYKPEAFIPQQLALGPYHYKRPELYDSGRHKMAAAKRTQKQLNNNSTGACFKFEHLVHNHLTKLESRIRSCYHGYLDFKPVTLTWIVAVDASFLLEFLQVCAIKEGVSPDLLPISTVSSSTAGSSSYLFNYNLGPGRRKSSHNVILRDIMMLENQLPLFILRKILEIRYSSLQTADYVLHSMLIGLFKEISPIKMNAEYFLGMDQVAHCAHLLDFLYHMLVSPKQEEDDDDEISEFDEGNDHEGAMNGNRKGSFGNTSYVKQLLNEVWNSVSKLNRGPMHTLKSVLVSRPVALVGKLPWTIITRLPGFALLKKPIENMIFSRQDKEEIKPENDDHNHKPPLMEEINIPSVAELYKSGVRFLPTNGNIETIRFDEETATLHLPIVCLDVNSDVILRNLVAYEASTASGPLVFTRFTELMNGIIDTEEDAKLLREGGIVMNHLKTDEEVANLWNGMCRSVRLTKVDFLDKMIEDVNKYYSGRWRVKLKKFIKIYIFGSWPFLTFLAAILLLLMTGLQAFCSVYSCARFFRIR